MRQYRQLKNIQQPERILVLCEGESEIIYLNGYKSEDTNRRRLSRLEIEIYQLTNYSPLGLVSEAKKKIKEAKKDKMPYKSVWVVFDKDAQMNIPQAIQEAQTYSPSIEVAF
ncbi:RloB domain-containing protein [Arachidicoccus soli]|uniref:RloB domain-containing protein n=1 Tax=Arachidicoccus soli TaxID=2341117 RepID=A0A386HQU1_9BACT|nr:RloB domain-containing protein [Arachidicoccus soli]AYD47946.1 RloB domain-containing protein [Arachidicoccus soli]